MVQKNLLYENIYNKNLLQGYRDPETFNHKEMLCNPGPILVKRTRSGTRARSGDTKTLNYKETHEGHVYLCCFFFFLKKRVQKGQFFEKGHTKHRKGHKRVLCLLGYTLLQIGLKKAFFSFLTLNQSKFLG